MALIIEDGTGVAGANGYTTATEVTAYLSERNRVEENTWSDFNTAEKEAAIISATDYIEQRFSERFLGRKQFTNVSAARGTLTFTDQPLDADVVVLGSITYTFNTNLGGTNSVLIGDSVDASIVNLIDAVSASSDKLGDTIGLGTEANTEATGAQAVGDRFLAVAQEKGTPGNAVATTTDIAAASWTAATLLGGSDLNDPQALSFPRLDLFDREGIRIIGMPVKLLQATAEYAVRAVDGTKLTPDPTVDESGQVVVQTKVRVGPITTETRFAEGGVLNQILKPFPAADRLLIAFLKTPGKVIRG